MLVLCWPDLRSMAETRTANGARENKSMIDAVCLSPVDEIIRKLCGGVKEVQPYLRGTGWMNPSLEKPG